MDPIGIYRAIIWIDGKVAQVGMSLCIPVKSTESGIYLSRYYDHETLYNIVPLIVVYEY